MFNTIVWATDGSEHADRALTYAKQLAAHEHAAVVAVHSVEHLLGPRAGGEALYANEDEIKAKVEKQVAELAEEGLEASAKIVGGPSVVGAAHMIADAAREVGADLIIVGTRGHNPVAGLFVGGVTQRLLHVAPCPVLAVPPVRQASEARDADAAHAQTG
jgi:nucleotide-binding universal stress UspA family protein